MWGVIPAAGRGSRIQPLAFSKELLPVGSRTADGVERPCAVSEYLVERMIIGGADRLCFVVGPGKSDILAYYGDNYAGVPIVYVVQPRPGGLCDAVFRASPVIGPDDDVVVGLPDTIWFPKAALAKLPGNVLSFLLFPVDRPELFDAVVLDGDNVCEIQVKQKGAASRWIWGAFRMPHPLFRALHDLWWQRTQADEYFGTLVNAFLAAGGTAKGVKAGEAYVDVGTLHGYRTAMTLLADIARRPAVELCVRCDHCCDRRKAHPVTARPADAGGDAPQSGLSGRLRHSPYTCAGAQATARSHFGGALTTPSICRLCRALRFPTLRLIGGITRVRARVAQPVLLSIMAAQSFARRRLLVLR